MRVTIEHVQQMKQRGERIAMLTAYDYATARLLDEAGVPLLLVGDSLGMVMLGYETTIPVTLDDVIHHTKAVTRATRRALVVGDLPFGSYQAGEGDALRSSVRLMQEGGCQAVKLEGGRTVSAAVRRLVESGIPVMGHLGLTPQSLHQLGGYRVQGRTASKAAAMVADAEALEAAGAFAIVLELVPAPLAELIGKRLRVPTIGIGAGAGCDGQVQVIHDLLGLQPDFQPRHAQRYAELGGAIRDAVQRYLSDVQSGAFPTAAHSFSMDEAVLATVRERLDQGRCTARQASGNSTRTALTGRVSAPVTDARG